MTHTKDRLSDIIRQMASEALINWTQEHDHPFGIISCVDVIISVDRSYADVIVSSSEPSLGLPKALARIAPEIDRNIGKKLGMRKNPRIRFRLQNNKKNPTDVLAIIDELDKKYDLSK